MTTVTTPWAGDGTPGDPLADIEALATVVRRDGKMDPKRLIFGASSRARFLANAKVQKALDLLRLNIGQIAPETDGLCQQTLANDEAKCRQPA
jgi:hypothetical protein